MINNINKKTKGFTLIELLVVISIISLLSTVVLASINDARERAENKKIVQEAIQLRNAIELYKSEFGTYPEECIDPQPDGSGSKCTSGGAVFYTGQDNWYYNDSFLSMHSDMSGLSSYLVDNNFIASLPEAKDDCVSGTCNFDIGYWTYPYDRISADGGNSSYDIYCGSDTVDDYLIYIYWDGRDLGLPELHMPNNTTDGNFDSAFHDFLDRGSTPEAYPNEGKTYCLEV